MKFSHQDELGTAFASPYSLRYRDFQRPSSRHTEANCLSVSQMCNTSLAEGSPVLPASSRREERGYARYPDGPREEQPPREFSLSWFGAGDLFRLPADFRPAFACCQQYPSIGARLQKGPDLSLRRHIFRFYSWFGT